VATARWLEGGEALAAGEDMAEFLATEQIHCRLLDPFLSDFLDPFWATLFDP
jgi:hypothetical protein